MDKIFTKLINEYKPKVIDGELTWEKEEIFTDDNNSNILPDTFTDCKDIKHIKAGKAAHSVDAKRKRNYSNTVRSFYENLGNSDN